jgi:hypothetical protein
MSTVCNSNWYLLCKEIMLLCDSLQTVLTVRHVPGNQNLIADALSRSRVPVNTEWSVWILGVSEVHLSKGWTSVTTTEDEPVVWEEQEYRPPTFE